MEFLQRRQTSTHISRGVKIRPILIIVILLTLCMATASYALTPIARWDVVPHQRINAGETFNIGVVAFSKNGIDRVEFNVTGQGYSGPSTLTSTEMTLNQRTDTWEYWVPIKASSFSTDGPIEISATVYGNDGGIRSSDDREGLGLDPLALTVNPQGSLNHLEVWVRAGATGGAVGSASTPFGTLYEALTASKSYYRTQYGTEYLDGLILKLMPGDYTIHSSVWKAKFDALNDWITITAADPNQKGEVRLVSFADAKNFRANPLKIQGITIEKTGKKVCLTGSPTGRIWIDDCDVFGRSDQALESQPILQSKKSGSIYWTNTYISNTQDAIKTGSGGQVNKLARGVVVEKIGDDAFTQIPLVINCKSNNLNPKSACGTTASTCGTRWHSDAWQYYGSHDWANIILYNYQATDLHYQGIMAGIADSGYTVKDIAFVNNYFELKDPIYPLNRPAGSAMLWIRGADHFLMWHNTFRYDGKTSKGANSFFHNSKDPSPDITNASFVGNAFHHVRKNGPSKPAIDESGSNHNHFEIYPEIGTPQTTILGTDESTGDPMLDSFGVPLEGSPLIDRISSIVVPVDANNNPRGNLADVGAFESGDDELVCLTGDTTFKNIEINKQAADFTIRGKVVANDKNMDAVTGFGAIKGKRYADYAILFRLNTKGRIDARNGEKYTSDAVLNYTPGVAYAFEIEVDMTSKTYDVYITPENSNVKTQIADNYSYRTEQANIEAFKFLFLKSGFGTHEVCDIALNAQ